jgi:DNA-binding transcriptional ArsR family regulator
VDSHAVVDVAPVAALLSAMAHPVRVAVLLHLDAHGPCDVSCLCEALSVEQSALSHQLAVLRKADLVRSAQRGRRRVYGLADAHVGHILRDAAAHVGCGLTPESAPSPNRRASEHDETP